MTLAPRFAPTLRCAIVFSFVACTGSIGDEVPADNPASASPSTSDPNSPSDDPTVPEVRDCSDNAQRGLAYPGVRRLTKTEIGSVLRSVWGSHLPSGTTDLLGAYPEPDELYEIETYDPLHIAEQLRTWAIVVDEIMQHPEQHLALVSDLLGPADEYDARRWQEVASALAIRLWRRPLREDERSRLVQSVSGRSATEGLPLLVGQLLRAPDFMFQIEEGILSGPQGDHARLSSHEVAARISFATVGTSPDQALIEAANQNQLETLEQVERHVRRLLRTPSAAERFHSVFEGWLGYSRTKQPSKQYVEQIANLGTNAGALHDEALREMQDFIDHVVWEKEGTFADLMTSDASFPRSSAMASVFGVEQVLSEAQSTPVRAPNHAGISMRPMLMLSSGTHTSPILRGVFVLQRLLCAPLEPPDADIVAARFDEVGMLDRSKLANHEVTEAITGDAPCSSCHNTINPVGFVYERFDPVGAWREMEGVWSAESELVATHPIPSPIADVPMGASVATYQGPGDFAQALAQSEDAQRCMAIHVFRQLQRRKETQADRCAVQEIQSTLSDGGSVADAFVRAVANEDIFWRRL